MRDLVALTESSLDPNDSGAAMALAELAKLHEEGLNQPLRLHANQTSGHKPVDHVSRRTAFRAKLLVAGGLAAVIAFAGVLVLVVSVLTTPTPTPHVAQQPEAVERGVATLTNVKDAAWQADAGDAIGLVVGDTLHPGQRLTLTKGFAELTTARGAVVTLEAPCTVELIENDNALRLVRGKLVGRVVTDDAQGFTVDTPHAVVIDFGTEFGIRVGQSGTNVLVLDGAVDLSERAPASADLGGAKARRTLRMEAGWSASVSSAGVLDDQATAQVMDEDGFFVRSIAAAKSGATHYRRAALLDKPIAYFSFDSINNGKADKWLPGSHLMTASRSLQPATGRFGGAARFDGKGKFELKYDAALNLTSDLTVEAWVWLDPTGSFRQRIISNGSYASGAGIKGFSFGVQLGREVVPMFTFYGVTDYLGVQPIPTQQWVHLAVSVDGQGEPTFYINGQGSRARLLRSLREDDSRTGLLSNQGMWIGAGRRSSPTSGDEAFSGLIDELAVYAGALTEQEIRSHFQAGQEPPRQ